MIRTLEINYFVKKLLFLLLFVFSSFFITPVFAISFTADAVQTRGKQISHAKIVWQNNRVRFDYVKDGVSMTQIFDAAKNRVIWLDNKNKQYVETAMPDIKKIQAMIKPEKTYNPCVQFKHASCIHLKEAKINNRNTDNWLITMPTKHGDYHIFQWIDKKYKVVLRQENSDGSALNATLTDKLILDGRKVHKLDMYAYSTSGKETHGVQWYDNKLNIVIKQQYGNNYIDELKNIKPGKIKQAMFVIPETYKRYKKTMLTAQKNDINQ